jgi:hypothetical protein
MGTLTLQPEQDGTGCFYGDYVTDDGDRVRVDVLPPRSHPRPYFVLGTDAMHDTDWLAFADGEQIARGERRDEVERAAIARLNDQR